MSCLKNLRRCKRELYRTMCESLMRIIEQRRRNVLMWEYANVMQHLRFDFWLWSRGWRKVAYWAQDAVLLQCTDDASVTNEMGDSTIELFKKILRRLHAAAMWEWGLKDTAKEICQKATAAVPYEI